METIASIQSKAKYALRRDFRDRLYELTLKNAGFSDAKAKAKRGGVGGSPEELPEYETVEPAKLDYGVSNPLSDNARLNTMALSRFRPEFIVHHQEPIVKAIVKAWIADEWARDNWPDKILAMDTDMPVYAYGIAHVGMIRPGKVGWKPYDALTTLWDPMNRLPEDWRYVYTLDEMDVDGVCETFPSLARKDVQKLGRLRGIAIQDGDTDAYQITQVRVWRYWSASCHLVFIGNMQDPNGIRLKLDSNMEYVRVEKGATESGPNPFRTVPFATTFEMLQPHVMNAVSRSHWEEPSATQRQDIERALGKVIRKSHPKQLIDVSRASKALQEKFRKGRSITEDDIADVLAFEGIEEWDQVFKMVPGAQLDPQMFSAIAYGDRRMNTSSGQGDAQQGQRTPGEKTAYEVATFLDESGIQRRHMTSRKSIGILSLIRKMMTISAEFDTEPRLLTLEDGRVIDTAQMPLNPILRAGVRVSVADSSLELEGERAKRQRLIAEFQQVWMPLYAQSQGMAVDISALANWLAGEMGYTDPAAMGIRTPQEFAAAQAAQQQAQMGAALMQMSAGKGQESKAKTAK